MKYLKLSVIVMFVLIYSTIVTVSGHSISSNGNYSTGEELYQTSCKSCHGVDGEGNSKLATMLKIEASKLDLTKKETVEKSDDALKQFIADGGGKMRGFKDKFSDGDLIGVVKHVRTLQK